MKIRTQKGQLLNIRSMVNIRLAKKSDAQGLLELNNIFNGAGSNSLEGITGSIGNNEQEILCVACEEEKLVGFCCGQIFKSMCYDVNYGEITEIFVLDEYRRLGVGKQLLDRMEVEFEKQEIRSFQLFTDKSNKVSQAFYDTCGYTITTERMYRKRNMEVKIIKENKKDAMELLLLADEQESMIDKYLDRGTMFALYDPDLKSICVVTDERDGCFEIQNIATFEMFQKRGYGRYLINHVCDYYKDKGNTMLVGTGDVPSAVNFYERSGFIYSHRIENYILDNYDEPIFEEGIQLIDKVYFKKDLCTL